MSKTLQKLTSVFLIFCLMAAMLPHSALAADLPQREYAATVYVSASGSNDNDGSPEAPVKTMTAAYEKLFTAMEAAGKATDPDAFGQIVVASDLSFLTTNGPTPDNFDVHDFTVVVTAEDPDEGLIIKNDYKNLGPTIFENITLTKHEDSDNLTYFSAEGYPLTIGEGVTTVAKSNGYHLCLVGGVINGTNDRDSQLTVQSGTWRNIYAGNYKGDMTGKASFLMTGGVVENTLCSTYNGNHLGDMDIAVTGGTVKGILYGGNSYTSGSHTGDVSISISDGVTVEGDIVAGGRNGLDGNITLSVANSTVTGTISAECSGTASIHLEAAQNQTLTLGGGALTVDSFTGGGTLCLGSGARLTLGAVTGTTQLSFLDTPYNTTYLITSDQVADEAFFVEEPLALQAEQEEGVKNWTISNGRDLVGLTLVAPEDVTLTVHTGFTSGSVLTPTQVTVSEGSASYLFMGVEPGNYRYSVSGPGYYTLTKNFIYTEEDAESGKTIQADPGKMAGTGFEPTGTINEYTDEVLNTLLASSTTQWPGYEYVFDTPAFTTPGKAEHQMTTQEEMMSFLGDLDNGDDNMYVYSLGTSPVYQYEIPIVVFTKTDLSGADTLEEAARLIGENEKVTVHYQAQIHSNEPAGGEAALSMIQCLDGTYGDQVLDTINIYVIPRINVDGANPYQRANVAQGIDMNRDHLYVQSQEIELVHYAYDLFMPEVAIDGHEFTATTTNATGTLDDVQVGAAGSLNSSDEVNDIAQDMVHNAFTAAEAMELRPYNYGSYASTVNNAIGRAYYGLYGSLSFLVETRGIGAGLTSFERRVMSQYTVIKSFLDYTVTNAAEIQTAVSEGRQQLADQGGIYSESDLVVLTHSSSKTDGYTISRPTWDLGDGSSLDAGASGTIYGYDEMERTRIRPTAYVLPKGQDWVQEAVSVLAKNGIEYYELAENTTVMLQQYMGSAADAQLTEETAVTFDEGAYVFPMNQVGANVLAMTMEPDVTDSDGYNGTLVQSGVVSAENGVFPIYRYIHDLNDQGQIDVVQLAAAPEGLSVVQPEAEYAPGKIVGLDPQQQYEYRGEYEGSYHQAPLGSTEIAGLEIGVYYVRFSAPQDGLPSQDCLLEVIDEHISSYTIYVDGTGGDDGKHGRTEDNAVATLDAAYEKISKLMKYAPEGMQGTIVFLDTVTLSGATELPAHSFPVVLTSKTGQEGISSSYNFAFNGETTLTDMTLTLTQSGLRYISANGNSVTFGENLTCVPSGSYYFNLVGAKRAATTEGDTHLTIQSGTWRNIYAASYTGNVLGDVYLTMTGGTVTAVVQTSYSGLTTGTVTMDLSGCEVQGNIFGGNTDSNHLIGDTTIILGPGASVQSVYGGSRDAGNVQGTATIILDGAQVNGDLNGGCNNTGGKVSRSEIVLKCGVLQGETQADRVVLDTSAGGTLEFLSDLTVDEVVGGGTATWPSEKTLSVTSDAVSGTTAVVLTGVPGQNTAYIVTPKEVSVFAFRFEGELAFSVRDKGDTWSWYLDDPIPVVFLVEGTEYAAVEIGTGGLLTPPETPVRPGYEFTGWYLGDTRYNFSSPVTQALELSAQWREVSSGSGSTRYTVKISQGTNGIVTADRSSAVNGTQVTLNVRPSNGYELASIAVTDANRKTISLSGDGSRYTFIMPERNVTVTATFILQGTIPFTDVDSSRWSYEAVRYAYQNSLFQGTSATTFSPEQNMTRGMLVTVLYRMAGSPSVNGTMTYQDVAQDAWYYSAVLWASHAGLVSGYSNDRFAPDDPVTREQIALILMKFAAEEGSITETAGLEDFSDQDQVSSWARQSMAWAVDRKLLAGKEHGMLDAGGEATREEVAQILMRFDQEVLRG